MSELPGYGVGDNLIVAPANTANNGDLPAYGANLDLAGAPPVDTGARLGQLQQDLNRIAGEISAILASEGG